MLLSALKNHLNQTENLSIQLPDGSFVPAHFHITEVGLITKHFIDCGGTVRTEKAANFQIWVAGDTDHRLSPQKLLTIINMSQSLLGSEDLELEVEYQGSTIGKYHLELKNGQLALAATQTNCLAQDKCGIPQEKLKVNLRELTVQPAACCTPGGGCC